MYDKAISQTKSNPDLKKLLKNKYLKKILEIDLELRAAKTILANTSNSKNHSQKKIIILIAGALHIDKILSQLRNEENFRNKYTKEPITLNDLYKMKEENINFIDLSQELTLVSEELNKINDN